MTSSNFCMNGTTMRRRFAMFAICGSSSARSDDENNKITDSLEQCLLLDKGIRDFQSFLKRGKFQDDEAALRFLLKCRSILAEASRYSPTSRNHLFSKKLSADVSTLFDLAGDVNFDQYQMETLENAFTSGTDQQKIDSIAEAEKWSMDVLQQIYEVFRKETLNSKR